MRTRKVDVAGYRQQLAAYRPKVMAWRPPSAAYPLRWRKLGKPRPTTRPATARRLAS